MAIQVTNGPEQVPQFASEAGRRRRLRDNMRAKTGAQKPLRESATSEPRQVGEAGGVLNLGTGDRGVLPRSVTTICLSLIRCKRGGPMDRPGLRTPADPRIPASNRIRAELGRKSRAPP